MYAYMHVYAVDLKCVYTYVDVCRASMCVYRYTYKYNMIFYKYIYTCNSRQCRAFAARSRPCRANAAMPRAIRVSVLKVRIYLQRCVLDVFVQRHCRIGIRFLRHCRMLVLYWMYCQRHCRIRCVLSGIAAIWFAAALPRLQRHCRFVLQQRRASGGIAVFVFSGTAA